MKKLAIFLFAFVLIVCMMTGCRRQTNGTPGDPTVNNDTTGAVNTIAPTYTTNSTTSTTEPTRHTTHPEASSATNNGTNSTESTADAYTDGSGSDRGRVIRGR